MRKTFCLSAFLYIICSHLFAQKVYYISNSGNDNNSGTTPAAPWQTLKTFSAGSTYLFKKGDCFYLSIPRIENPTLLKTVIAAYGIGPKPILSLYTQVNKSAWQSSGYNLWKVNLKEENNFNGAKRPNSNIGFLKFNNTIYGNKLSKLSLLQKPWDFYSDEDYLYVYSNVPLSQTDLIFFSSNNTILHLSNGLAVRGIKVSGSGGHGIQGYNLKNVTIRDVAVTEIGGSYLPGFGDGTVRYGNGIEFWNGSENCMVQDCKIEQVYDVALTLQGFGKDIYFLNTTFKNNVVNRNEQSFEAWAREGAKGFTNCKFINNQCYNAGYGWSHAVRPFKESAVHILTYAWQVKEKDLTIEGNKFYRAKSGLYFHNVDEDIPAFISRNNKIYLSAHTPIRSSFPGITAKNKNAFINSTGKEAGSSFKVIR